MIPTNMTWPARFPQVSSRSHAMQLEDAANPCRRVCNMTPEQVSRKRAIDRDNQRHLRAKRKAYTNHLEEEITRLRRKLADSEARIAALEQEQQNWSLREPSAAAKTAPASVDPGRPGPDMATLTNVSLRLSPGITLNLAHEGEFFDFLDIGADLGLPAAADYSKSTSPGHGTTTPAGDWAVPIEHTPPTNRLDRFITATVAAWRNQVSPLSTRQSAELSATSQFPNVSALLNHAEHDGPVPSQQPISSAASAHVHGSPLQPLVERLGITYCLSHLVRWLVSLSKDTYDRMPTYLRPTPLQLAVPHPAWVDLVIFPAVRDELIRLRDWDSDRFEAFRTGTASSLSVNWPFVDSGAVVELGDDGQVVALNPIFEAHVRNLDNWTVSAQVAREFPSLAPYVCVRRGASAPL